MNCCPVRWTTLLTRTLTYPVHRTNWIMCHRSIPHLTVTSHSPMWLPCCLWEMLQGPSNSSGNKKAMFPSFWASETNLTSRLQWMWPTHLWRSSGGSSPTIFLIWMSREPTGKLRYYRLCVHFICIYIEEIIHILGNLNVSFTCFSFPLSQACRRQPSYCLASHEEVDAHIHAGTQGIPWNPSENKDGGSPQLS